MSKRLYTHRRLRYWYTYDIDEICAVFADKGLHPQTVRGWIKAGLKTIDSGKPVLIYGNDLISFLKKRNDQNKCSTAFDQFYCFKCRDARSVFQNRIAIKQQGQFLKASGHCRQCKTRMYKSYSLAAYPQLRQTFKLVGVSELYDCSASADKTHLDTEDKTPPTESGQGSLF